MEEHPCQYSEKQPRVQSQREKEQAPQYDGMMEKFGLGQALWVSLPEVTHGSTPAQRAMGKGVPDVVINIDADAGEQGYPHILF